jgi:mRNA interferase MazF
LSIEIASRRDVWVGLDKTSAAAALQIRSVSTERLAKKLGSISSTAMEEIMAAIAAVIEYQ